MRNIKRGTAMLIENAMILRGLNMTLLNYSGQVNKIGLML